MKLEIFGKRNIEANELQKDINAWFKKHPKINVKHIDTFVETDTQEAGSKTNYYNIFVFYEG